MRLLPLPGLFLMAAAAFAADLPPADLDAKLTEAREMAATGRKAEAFVLLEEVIRSSTDQAHKFSAREEMLKMGPIPARPQNDGERAQVAAEIMDERHRYYGDVMDKLAGEMKLRGVRLFRKRIMSDGGGGSDGEKTALRELEARILRELLAKEDREEVEKIKKSIKKEQWMDAAKDAEKRGKKHMALEIYKDAWHWAGITDEKAVEELRKKIDALEIEVLDMISPEEQKAFDDAVNHRVWADLITRESHHFIFIGDKGYVPRIPAESILELDIAYIFITDMIARQPDDDGQRITIFFKELWNFGGGVGGGKTIKIGSVNPKQKDITVSNFLYFHELCHCLFDTAMIWVGFVEGVANFGATMASCSLGHKADGENLFKSNLEAFHRDFLGRDETYWRIQNYGPSCGFWLFFLDKYGKGPDGAWDWSLYRKWFRLWRAHPIPPDETVEKARVFGRCLSDVFGDGVWKDLKSFGWPVIEDDEGKTKVEKDELVRLWRKATNAWNRGDADDTLLLCEDIALKYPEHFMAAKARRLALQALEKTGGPGKNRIRKELGLVMEWKCCGPFYSKTNTALFDVFGPEFEVDYAKEYPSPYAKGTWFDPKIRFDGIVAFEFPYMDGIACYGLVNAKVPSDTDAWLWIGSNDAWGAWVNGELADKYDVGRGVLPDNDRVEIRLRAGWNRVLVKIRNGDGEMGFVGRITDRKGTAIEGLELTHEPQEVAMLVGRKPARVDPIWKDDFTAVGAPSRYVVPCGGWKVTNKVMFGTDDKRNMGWMKFLVTPGKEKDAPAQCLWVKDTTFKGGKDLAIDLKLALGADGRPKFGVELDGEGLNDGLSGTTLVFHPNGEGCSVVLWRYDHMVYHNPQVTFKEAKEHTLRVVRYKDRMTVTFDAQSVFDDVSMPAINKSNFVGIMTWDKGVGIDDLAIYKLAEK